MIARGQEAPAARTVPWGVLEVLAGCLAALGIFAALVVVTALLVAALEPSERGRTVLALLANVCLEVLAALAVILLVVKGRGAAPADLGFRPVPLRRLWWVPAFLATAFAVLTVYAVLVQALGLDWLMPGEQMPPGVFDAASTVVLSAAMVVLVAPVAEELFFRGFVFAGLVARLGVGWAAAASGLLFGLVHGQVGLILPFAMVGALLALLYHRSGSLWVPIAAHLAYNGLAFTALALMERAG
ncbi:MAG TPA: type II CAAX endopeptidase family protein [Dehalococcoidia bacterium]